MTDAAAIDVLATDVVAAFAQEKPLRPPLAVAESLTGGALASALVAVPGASAVLAGGVVAYESAAKHGVLGVDEELLRRGGAVQAEVAAAMVSGVRALFGCCWAVATTGVAGPAPDPQAPVGRVHLAVGAPSGIRTVRLDLRGTRADIRGESVRAALVLLREAFAAERHASTR